MPDLPADDTTTAILTYGTDVTGSLETYRDRDWYQIDVAPGAWVQVTQRGTGANPVSDSFLRVYDSEMNLLTADDELNASNSNLDAALLFDGGVGGTYYIEAASYRDRTTGDYVLNAQQVAAPRGSLADVLESGNQRSDRDISVYFVPEGDRANQGYRTSRDKQDDITSDGWTDYEMVRFIAAFDAIAAVTNVTFTITDNPNADYQLVLDDNELQNNGLLGYFYQPSSSRPSVGVFNAKGQGWSDESRGGLEKGGLGYATIVHELLHGLGLDHPHESASSVAGTHVAFEDLGANGYNQGIYTTMSYNGGYATTGHVGRFRHNEAGPMTLDIIALQDLYGANTTTARGDDSYVLFDDMAYWEAIWDAAGHDTIRYDGTADTTIDLRAADLAYGQGGAGHISSVDGFTGGYLIAYGVQIEGAVGGAGNDTLIASDADSRLEGNDGDDQLIGGTGDDTLIGGAGQDALFGGIGNDDLSGGAGDDSLTGNAGADRIAATAGQNEMHGGGGADVLTGGVDNDLIHGGSGDDMMTGGDGNDVLFGGRGRDIIDGGDGDDQITGGWGADTLTGGLGADSFVFHIASDSAAGRGQRDVITDFETGHDMIDLGLIATSAPDGLAFIGTRDFDGAGQLRLDQDGTDAVLQLDADGDGHADLEILLLNTTDLSASDLIL
ncbi:M10 family metallopeptidase C-terminal domain-containing protein [Yoonia sp. SS1-5]|uniref:M10 family metallopeptidase C-terminal domain-containing protein n=1 Tax=Yoonia rhodophyticola TaxID=3137370 RepID=A0AAN0NIZ1_9RHOB